MANSITTHVVGDGGRNTRILVNLIGDNSGQFTNEIIFDPADYLNKGVNKKIDSIQYVLNGFCASLLWGSSISNQPIVELEKDHYSNFEYDGGVSNNTVAGRNGKILLTTREWVPNGNAGYIILSIELKINTMGKADFYRHGDNNVYCDVCGQKFKASMCRFKWNNMLACKACYEIRNPQDFLKGVKDDTRAAIARPEPADKFVTNDISSDDL